MEERQRRWYEKNRDRILEERRTRYKTDLEYQEQKKKSARNQREDVPEGVCRRHPQTPVVVGRKSCSLCLQRKREDGRRRHNSPEKKAWREANKQLLRERRIVNTYKLSPEAYRALWESQGGRCAICPAPATDVDHDHSTGQVRGLLCSIHNRGLGHFQDSVETLERAAAYLRSKNGQ